MKTLTKFFILGGVLLFSSQLFAATYEYIDVNGHPQIEVANSPEEAIVTAPNRAHDSGVMVVSEAKAVSLTNQDGDTEIYAYVKTNGEISLQPAENPREAIVTAPNRAHDSGVMVVAR